MAADTHVWVGTAIPVPEVKSYTFAGTWATGDTATITINGKTLTLTAGTTVTVTQMAADMVDMINGAAANQDETRSALGSTVGEFALLTASSTAGVMLLTGADDGRPIGAVTVDKTSTSGTFAASSPETVTTGTGPHHAKDVDNWDTGVVPEAGDTIVFDHQACAGPKYDMAMAIAPAAVYVTDGFKYGIGLPQVNRDTPSYPFDEHLPCYMTYTSCVDVRINSTAGSAIKLDFGSAATNIAVDGTGRATETNVPPLCLKANHSSNTLVVSNGDVGLCIDAGTTGNLATLHVGGITSPTVQTGTGVTLATVVVDTGTVEMRSAITTLTVNGGLVTHIGGAIGATTLTVNGGTFRPQTAGTYGTVSQSGGLIDATVDGAARTFTDYYFYGGSFKDPAGTVTHTNGIRVYPKLAAGMLDLPPIRKYTIGAV